MSVGKEDIQENADHVADERPSRAASDQGLNRPISKSIAEGKRHRKTYCGKHQCYE